MAPKKHPAQATRGNLSARQWQDLRQAARLARSEGVSITWRRDGSLLISPPQSLKDSTTAAGNPRRVHEAKRETTHDDVDAPQPSDTDGKRARSSKKQQRDAQRAAKRRTALQSEARWQLLTQRLLWTARKETCNAVWTGWMRARSPEAVEAKLAARRKLRDLLLPWLWHEWTRPRIEPPPLNALSDLAPTGLQVLGPRSLRDEFIRARARALCNHLSGPIDDSKALWAWLGFQCVIDFDRTHPGARSREEAGLRIPSSARNRKTSRGGKKS